MSEDFPLPNRVHVKVYLCGGNGTMPQYLLDIGDVNIFFQQKCGKSVAKSVRGHMFGNATFVSKTMDETSYRLWGKAITKAIDKEVFLWSIV